MPLVIGLFFLIVTLQKARTPHVAARDRCPLVLRWFVRSLLQVLVVVGLGVAIGTLLYLPAVVPARRFDPAAVRALDASSAGDRHPRARRSPARGSRRDASCASSRPRRSPAGGRAREVGPARDAPPSGSLRHRDRAAHPHRDAADAARRSARRADPSRDRRDPRAARRPRRVLCRPPRRRCCAAASPRRCARRSRQVPGVSSVVASE